MKNRFISLIILVILNIFIQSIFPNKIQAQNTFVLEVTKIYLEQGDQGVKEYSLKNKAAITVDSIIALAKIGKELEKETFIKIAITVAETLQDKDAIAWGIYYHGRFYEDKNKNSDALAAYDKALQLFIEIKDFKGQAYSNNMQADIYLSLKNYTSAKESYLNVIKACQHYQNDYLQGYSYTRLGSISSDTGDYESALKLYSTALVYLEKDKDEFTQGFTYYGIGTVWIEMNDFVKALEMFAKSAEHYKAAGLVSSGQVAAIFAQGDIYKYMNNYQKALEMYSSCLTYYEKQSDNYGLGNTYLSMGKIYLDIGDNQKATEMFAKALPYCTKAGDKIGVAYIYISFGDIYSSKGNKLESLKMYVKAVPYIKQASARYSVADLYLRVGQQFNYYDASKESLDTYSLALNIYEAVNDLSNQGLVNLESGKVLVKIGEMKKTAETYSKASTLITKANAIGLKADLNLAEAFLFSKENENEKAFQKYDSAMTILDKIRTETGFADMKMAFTEKISRSIEDAVIFMIKNNYTAKAFQYLESMKARTLLDQLTEKNILQIDKGLNPKLKLTRDNLVSKLSFIKSSLTKAIDEKEIKKLQTEKSNIEQDWDKLSRQIRFQNPAYASIMYPQTIDTKELQNKILKPDEVLISYFLSPSDGYAFITTKNNFQIVKLPDSTSQIEREVQTYQRSLQYNRPTYESNLYNMLIEPIVKYIKDYKIMLIVPDGFLTTIPFESIIVSYDESKNKTKYLIEDYTIKYIQSATMLSLLRTKLKHANASDKFIGFGDPVYDYENFIAGKQEKGTRDKQKSSTANLKGNNYDRSGGLMNRLEGSGQEINEIAKLFGANKSKIFTRIEAKEENIKKLPIKDYGYITLSCHGLASDEFQSLVLSQIPNSEEDGYLTLDEIMNLDWNARLVVLSACQTGKGKIRRGEGVIGLTRAVMHAGTSAAVVSLWNVSDEGTKELMIKLYKNILQKKLSKEEALRKAKIEMLNSKFSNPYFWSAFIMYGE